jgi:protein phosphatase
MSRYLWVPDPAVAQIPTGELIQGRYEVVSAQVWRDTQPEILPFVPSELIEGVSPYLHLFPQRLHVPEVHGWTVIGNPPNTFGVMLLENVPIDSEGDLYPSILDAWETVSTTRQVYWLWQILQLWTPLSSQGVAASLLVAENIRVQGWRIWLRELGRGIGSSPSLQDLGHCWLEWTKVAATPGIERLQEIAMQMSRGEIDLEAIATSINQILLEQTAQMPLRLQVAGATDTGPMRSSNEDACYPTASDLQEATAYPNDLLIPYFSLVCDGIGGHEGGEIASALALQTLKLQIRALLVEIISQKEIVAPTLVMEQLSAIIRVVNNMISNQNDTQGRTSRARMGTTLVMALQLPQVIRSENGEELGKSRELYIATVGDSRAYWMTLDYCHQLTLDDDIATREVKQGRNVYQEALQRADAGALTQALGTRDAKQLHPNIRRFMIEEDGLLLLCSDGLSDRALVENSWREFAKPVLKGKISLETAVKLWIDLANETNGHDNTSVVLTCCLVSNEPPSLFDPTKQPQTTTQTPRTVSVETEMTAASRALLYDESKIPSPPPTISVTPHRRKPWAMILGAIASILVAAGLGYGIWLTFKPPASVPENVNPPSN